MSFNPDFKSSESQDAVIAAVAAAGLDPANVLSDDLSPEGYHVFTRDAEGRTIPIVDEDGITDFLTEPRAWPDGFDFDTLIAPHLAETIQEASA